MGGHRSTCRAPSSSSGSRQVRTMKDLPVGVTRSTTTRCRCRSTRRTAPRLRPSTRWRSSLSWPRSTTGGRRTARTSKLIGMIPRAWRPKRSPRRSAYADTPEAGVVTPGPLGHPWDCVRRSPCPSHLPSTANCFSRDVPSRQPRLQARSPVHSAGSSLGPEVTKTSGRARHTAAEVQQQALIRCPIVGETHPWWQLASWSKGSPASAPSRPTTLPVGGLVHAGRCELELTHLEDARSATFDRGLRKLNDRKGRRTSADSDRQDLSPATRATSDPSGMGPPSCASTTARDPHLLPARRRPAHPLLCGGDKCTQPEDIKTAHRIAGEWRRHQGRQS
jgi:hypothetical protein